MAASSSTSSTRNTSPGRKDKQQNNSTDNSTATIYKTLDEVDRSLYYHFYVIKFIQFYFTYRFFFMIDDNL